MIQYITHLLKPNHNTNISYNIQVNPIILYITHAPHNNINITTNKQIRIII